MVFTMINDNPYRWYIFYLVMQFIVLFPIMLFAWYINGDHRQTGYVFAVLTLLFALIFVLSTVQGERRK